MSFTDNVLNAYIYSVVVPKSGSEFSPESWDEDVPNDTKKRSCLLKTSKEKMTMGRCSTHSGLNNY